MKSIEALIRIVRSGVVACTLVTASVQVSAEIVGSFVINGDGTVTYSYIVDNSAGSFDVAIWSLDFPLAAPDWDQLDTFTGGDVAVPNSDWFADAGIPVSGQSAQDFISLNPAGDVLVGDVLGGFSFTSSFQPGPISFYEFSALGDVVSGLVVGPAVVGIIPEGSAWLGALTLSAAIAIAVRRGLRVPPSR